MEIVTIILTIVTLIVVGCTYRFSNSRIEVVQSNLGVFMREKYRIEATDQFAIVEVGEVVADQEQIAFEKAYMQACSAIAHRVESGLRQLLRNFNEENPGQVIEYRKEFSVLIANEIACGAVVARSQTDVTKEVFYRVTILMTINANVFEKIALALKLPDEIANKICIRAAHSFVKANVHFGTCINSK